MKQKRQAVRNPDRLPPQEVKALRKRWAGGQCRCVQCGKEFSSKIYYRVHLDQHERIEKAATVNK